MADGNDDPVMNIRTSDLEKLIERRVQAATAPKPPTTEEKIRTLELKGLTPGQAQFAAGLKFQS